MELRSLGERWVKVDTVGSEKPSVSAGTRHVGSLCASQGGLDPNPPADWKSFISDTISFCGFWNQKPSCSETVELYFTKSFILGLKYPPSPLASVCMDPATKVKKHLNQSGNQIERRVVKLDAKMHEPIR